MNKFENFAPGGKFNVILLGPMGPGKDTRTRLQKIIDRLTNRAIDSTEHHLGAMKSATEKALSSLRFDADQFEIYVPPLTGAGGIVDTVFAKIDEADFAIAEISNRGANVFYEIAMLNALGTPVILLDRENQPVPFYWTMD